MSSILQFRRAGSSTRLSLPPADGELFFDTDVGCLFIGDGSTLGGRLVSAPSIQISALTGFTVAPVDAGKLIVFTGAGCAVTLAQAGSSAGAFFPDQTGFCILNLGSAPVVVTPTTSTINAGSTISIPIGSFAEIYSNGANYFALQSGSGGSSSTTVTVVNKTANFSITSGESSTRYTNTGAGGTVVGSLPAAVIGLNYGLSINAAQILRFDANGTDTINWAGTTSAAGGTIDGNVVGWFLLIECHVTGKWIVTQIQGGWTVT